MRLYAFDKISNGVRHEQNNKQTIVSAFKANSIMQLSNLSIDMAQARYSALAEKLNQMDYPCNWGNLLFDVLDFF